MSSNQPIRVLIVGAGAVGCFYGSRLHRQPEVLVSLVCRSNYKTIVAQKGVHLRTRSFGEYFFSPEYVFPSIDAAANPQAQHLVNPSSAPPPSSATSTVAWDYIVITTKALPDVSDDSARVAGVMKSSPAASIVLIQNGVGVEEPYRQRFPLPTPILSAVTVVSAEQVEEGVVVQNRWTRISIGPYTVQGGFDKGINDSVGTRKTAEFVNLLKLGGIKDAEEYDERGLQTVRWHKIAINASMNPSAVLSNGTTNAEMAKDPELERHLRDCMYEVFRGAEAVLGRPFPSHLATPEQILKSTERNTGGKPSMLVDWEKGARMELEVILGNPVRAARAKGVEMYRLQTMYALLKMAQKRRDEEKSLAAKVAAERSGARL